MVCWMVEALVGLWLCMEFTTMVMSELSMPSLPKGGLEIYGLCGNVAIGGDFGLVRD